MGEITSLIERIEVGEPDAADRLLTILYAELRAAAASIRARQSPDFSLEATDMVHMAFAKLVKGEMPAHWKSGDHVMGAFVTTMKWIVIDSARRRKASRHGGGMRRVGVPGDVAAPREADDEVLDVSELLDGLRVVNADAARVVECHFFCGLTMDATAEALGISERTAYRKWDFARAWLYGKVAR